MIHPPVRIQGKHEDEREGSKKLETRKTRDLCDVLLKIKFTEVTIYVLTY
jgi:hypothetical protein